MAITETTTATTASFPAAAATYPDERSSAGTATDTDHEAVIGAPDHALLAGPWGGLRHLPVMTVIAVPWFFYRKMFLAGAAALFGVLIVASHWPVAVALLAPINGLATRPTYRRFIRSRVAKADARNLTGSQRLEYLARAGGTSTAAACFATAIALPLFFALLLRHGVL